MSNILVTGGAGYIGSHTCKALAGQGYVPVVFDNLSEGHREFVKWGELIEGDIRDSGTLEDVMKHYSPQAVIHFAASAYVGESVSDPLKYYQNNVAGSIALLEAMQAAACDRLIFSSSCAVYGEVDSLPITVQHPTAPINPYGRTKLAVEQMLTDCAASQGLNSVSLRYFNAAGADLDGELGERHIPETHLIPNIINAALETDAILQIYGDDYDTPDGTCIRDFIHVADLAAAHVAAVNFLEENSGCYRFNLGAGDGVSIKQLIQIVEQQLGVEVSSQVHGRRSGDPATLYADISETTEILNWQPANSGLETIIKSAIAWARTEQKAQAEKLNNS